jgi:hypothetical protein
MQISSACQARGLILKVASFHPIDAQLPPVKAFGGF